MKKQYIIPQTETIMVETQAHMLFGSPDGENRINGGGNMGNYGGSGQLSRESDWDE